MAINHLASMLQVLREDNRTHGDEPYKQEVTLGTAGPYHNELEPFFGPPTKKIDHNPSDQFPHEAWFLPDAYEGAYMHL